MAALHLSNMAATLRGNGRVYAVPVIAFAVVFAAAFCLHIPCNASVIHLEPPNRA